MSELTDMTSKQSISTPERQLIDVLINLSDSISFCASGTTNLVLPGLDIDGVGEIGIPVSAKDAKGIIKQASQAPYGRGEETVVDTRVRKAWQLEPAQFRLQNRQWDSLVDGIVKEVRTEFGINRKVVADLYKLLVYEKGSFFIPHRDTEKAEGMFATLVICLPSKHEGGSLVVSHAGQSHEIKFGGDESKFDLQYAAFYADCQHEVRPVTKGYRVCLIYNLTIARRKKQPLAPQFNDAIDTTAEVLTSLFDDEERSIVAVPLVHQYTEAGLAPEESDTDSYNWDDDDAWDTEDDDWDDEDEEKEDESDTDERPLKKVAKLDPSRDYLDQIDEAESDVRRELQPLQLKGADRARVDVLTQAANKANCRVYVALLTHWQSGYPDYGSLDYVPYGSRWGSMQYEADISDENQSAEFEEVFDESITLSHWFDVTGRQQPFESLDISESEIISDLPYEDRSFRQELHEATGNAGVSMERWYHQAVVVVWPEAKHFHVLASQGAANSVPALCELVEATDDPGKCEDSREFADQILQHWQYRTSRRQRTEVTLASRMIDALLAIADKQLAVRFVKFALPLEYAGIDGTSFARLAEQAGWKQLEAPLKALFATQKPDDFESDLAALTKLYGSICCCGPRPSVARKSVCKALADEVEQMLDRWDRGRSTSQRNAKRTGVVEPVVRGMCASSARDHLKRFLEKVTTDAKHYDLHTSMIPAVSNLLDDKTFSGSTAAKLAQNTVKKLLAFCVNELKRRTETEPKPPADWFRPGKLDCKCDDCRELAMFLKDKKTEVLRLPRRQDLRQHLHRQIDSHRLDLAHVTERRGRPYILVCTKNQASYERELAQFKTDEELLRQLISR